MLVKDVVSLSAIMTEGYEELMATMGMPKAIGPMPWHSFWVCELVRKITGATTEDMQKDFNMRNEPLAMVQWFQSGLPRFDLSHHAAVAFANTDCDNVCFEDARMPFPSIVIELPNPSPFSLKSIFDGRYKDVRRLHLNTYMAVKQELLEVDISSRDWAELERKTQHLLEPFLAISAVAEDTSMLYQRGDFRADMTLLEWTRSQKFKAHDEDQEAARMMLNIAINTLVYLHAEGKRYVPSRPVARPRRGAHHANDSGYRPTIYRVGDNIRLNNLKELRDLSRETSRGGQRPPGWTLRSRSTVRGHWKQQAHGPGRALRKRVFVQPYWRGPEAAEALLRAYEVKP